MLLAPHIPMSGTVVHIDAGVAGVMQTLAVMRELVRRYRVNMAVRRAAANVMFLTPERDEMHRARALFEWVRDHVRYVPDVLEVETIHTPEHVLASLVGDCDDQATLLAAMFEAVGYPTRFVVAGYTSPDAFEHVYVEVCAGGAWWACDATEDVPFGWAPPAPLVVYREGG